MDLLILLLTFLTTAIAADNCSITPIFVDFHDRCVDNCFTIQYGLFMGFGTPFQNESLWPSLSHNESTIAGLDFCADGSSARCVNQTHGIYSAQVSADFQRREDYVSLDSDDATTQNLAAIEQTGLDTLNIYTHYFDPSPPSITRLPDFPLTVLSNFSSPASPWFGPAGILGLGPSSTLLKLLHDAKLISSRSFGLYVGTAYPRAGGVINGSLTLGGYDSGRFTDDAVRYDLSPPAADARDPSPYKVSIASVSLTDTGNNNATTVLSSGAFDAYLTTSQYEMTLPDDVTQSFIETTSATPAEDSIAATSGPDITPLTLPSGFKGEMTITLASGINITLSTSDGTLRNTSNLTPLTGPSSSFTGPRIPLLGTSLLAHLYLTASYDATPPSFFLSPAAMHGKYVITQPLCPNDTPEAYVQHKISSFQRNGIIGAVLGGVIGGIGLSFAVFWCWRKWMQKRAGREWEEMSGDGNGNGKSGYDVDEEGMKVLASAAGATGAGAAAASKRAKLIGILKPSSARRQKRLDKGKNPITAYYAERNASGTAVGLPKKSWSSSDTDNDDEGYQMTQLQGALPPQHQQNASEIDFHIGEYRGMHAGLMRERSESRSRSRDRQMERERSPSPVFSPDERITQGQYLRFAEEQQRQQEGYYGAQTQQQERRSRSRPEALPVSRAFPQVRNDSYANVPLTPNTPMPLLGVSHNSSPQPSPGLRPYTPSHLRSNSEERRRQLGLTVNTYFEGPPTTADRVGKKLKIKKDKTPKEVVGKERERIARKPVSEDHGLLRKMFPAG